MWRVVVKVLVLINKIVNKLQNLIALRSQALKKKIQIFYAYETIKYGNKITNRTGSEWR